MCGPGDSGGCPCTCATRTTPVRSGSGTARATATRTTREIGVVAQQYLPDELQAKRYYEPTNHGQERDVQARLEKIRRILDGTA